MSAAKIRLSLKEQELVRNADFILTKNHVLGQVGQLLASLQLPQKEMLQKYGDRLPAAWQRTAPKISKGERYLGLPYQVLDHPRYFSTTDVLAIRTMFWWGHHFSVTLHIAGESLEANREKWADYCVRQTDPGLYMAVGNDQWQHHFEQENFRLMTGFDAALRGQICLQGEFLKLSYKTELSGWDTMDTRLLDYFERLLKAVLD